MLRRVAVALWVIAPAAALAGDVAGRVAWTGTTPAAAHAYEVTKDRATCGESQPDESFAVTDGGLANVVVRIDVPGAKAAPRRAALGQRGCRYVPHVQAVPVGSTLDIGNADPILHNVHGYLGTATAFNVPMPLQDQKVPRLLARAGVVRVGCDVHGWMSAWVVVTEGPYVAVSDAAGRFAIPGVPAGTWDAVAWHERFGEKRAKVKAAATGEARLELAYP